MHCFRASRIVDRLRVLAFEVRGKNRMDRATMNMTRIPMTMIRLRMHMEEWNHEHPYGRPHEDHHPRPRWLVRYLSHREFTLAQFSSPSNQPIPFPLSTWTQVGWRFASDRPRAGEVLRLSRPQCWSNSSLLVRLRGVPKIRLHALEALGEKRLCFSVVHSRGDDAIFPVLPVGRRRDLELRSQLK